MALYTVSSGSTINANDVNQFTNTLQQASGGQETAKYHLMFNSYTTGALGQIYISTRSRGSTPVSVTIDTSDQSPSACNAPSTNFLTASGFQIYSSSTSTFTSCNCGGNWTVQY